MKLDISIKDELADEEIATNINYIGINLECLLVAIRTKNKELFSCYMRYIRSSLDSVEVLVHDDIHTKEIKTI